MIRFIIFLVLISLNTTTFAAVDLDADADNKIDSTYLSIKNAPTATNSEEDTTVIPVSSDWAYRHLNDGGDPHPIYLQVGADQGMTITVSGPKITGSDPAEKGPTTLAREAYWLSKGFPATQIIWNVVGEEADPSGAGRFGTYAIDPLFNKLNLAVTPQLWYDRMFAQINRADSTKLPDNMRGTQASFNDVIDCSLLVRTCSNSSYYGYAISSDTYVYGRQVNIQLTSLLNALRVTGDQDILDEINSISDLMYAELEDPTYGDYSIQSLYNQNYVTDGYRNWRQWYDGTVFTKSGTYNRTGTTVTLSIAGHGLVSTDRISIDFAAGSGGTATDGTYTVTVVDTGTYTVIDSVSGTITNGTAGQKSGYFGTDIHEMNEIMAHGFVAAMAYALHVNRDVADTTYGENAAAWVDYLRNDYEARWRSVKGIAWPTFPFTYRPFSHVYANQIRYHYYLWKLLSEDPTTAYYDLAASQYYYNEAVRMAAVMESHLTTVPDVCGTTDAFQWLHMMDGTPGIQPTNYAGYTIQALADMALQGFGPFAETGFMEKMACTITNYIMDENLPDNVSGYIDGTGTWSSPLGYAYSPYTDIGYWDSTGEIITQADIIHDNKETDDENPQTLSISAGMLFSTMKP